MNSIFKNLLDTEILTKEKERSLLENRDKGNNRDILITSNIRYVISLVKKFQNKGVDFEDLISFGIEGLIKAIDHYDLSKNVKLITYAKFWIIQNIQINILKNTLIEIPYNRIKDFNKIKAKIKNGSSYTEALEELGLKKEKNFFPEYLFNNIDNFTNDIEDKRIDLQNQLIKNEKIEILNQAIESLKQREKEIIKMKLDGISNKDIGEILKISKQRIHQIYIKSQEKIKNYLEILEFSIN